MAEDDEKKSALGIDWLRTIGGAIAAVCTALLLSTLGAAGTIIGAALGSVAATVGTAFWTEALARSREKVARAQRSTARKVGVAEAEVRRAQRRSADETAMHAHLDRAEQRLAEARRDLEHPEDVPTGAGAPAGHVVAADRVAALPWGRVAVTAVAVFATALAAITAFELLSGRSISSRTGGGGDRSTTIGSVTGSGDKQEDREEPGQGTSPSPSPSPTEETTPTGTPETTPEPTPPPGTTPEPTPTGELVEPALPPPPAPSDAAPPGAG